MEHEPTIESNVGRTKSVLLVGILFCITIISALVPASWFGVTPIINNDQSLDLISVESTDATPKDEITNKPLTWKQLGARVLSDQPEVLSTIENTPEDPVTIAQLNDDNNLTASFSRNFLVASAYMKDNNITDEGTQGAILKELTDKEVAKLVPTTYALKDIHLAKTETKDSIKEYGNTLARILSGLVSAKTVTDNGKSLHDFSETKDPSALLPLKKDEAKVSAAVTKLLSISVPPSAAIYHIAALNHISLYKENLANLAAIETDPLRANIALQTYTNNVTTAFAVYWDMAAYFDVKNIVFSSKDPGYVFTVGYTSQ